MNNFVSLDAPDIAERLCMIADEMENAIIAGDYALLERLDTEMRSSAISLMALIGSNKISSLETIKRIKRALQVVKAVSQQVENDYRALKAREKREQYIRLVYSGEPAE